MLLLPSYFSFDGSLQPTHLSARKNADKMSDNYNFVLPDSPGDEESEDHPFVTNLNFDKLGNYFTF